MKKIVFLLINMMATINVAFADIVSIPRPNPNPVNKPKPNFTNNFEALVIGGIILITVFAISFVIYKKKNRSINS